MFLYIKELNYIDDTNVLIDLINFLIILYIVCSSLKRNSYIKYSIYKILFYLKYIKVFSINSRSSRNIYFAPFTDKLFRILSTFDITLLKYSNLSYK